MSHRIEVTMGLITSAIVVIGLEFAVFGAATYSYGTDWMSSASTSLWDQGLESGVVIYLAAMLVFGLGVTGGADQGITHDFDTAAPFHVSPS